MALVQDALGASFFLPTEPLPTLISAEKIKNELKRKNGKVMPSQ
jgi:hypothetical protein